MVVQSDLWGNINGLCLFPFIFVRDTEDEELINHEKIHFQQQKELFIIGFYVMYLVYSLRGYKQNPFEIEAFENQYNLDYLKTRKRYAFKN